MEITNQIYQTMKSQTCLIIGRLEETFPVPFWCQHFTNNCRYLSQFFKTLTFDKSRETSTDMSGVSSVKSIPPFIHCAVVIWGVELAKVIPYAIAVCGFQMLSEVLPMSGEMFTRESEVLFSSQASQSLPKGRGK